MTIINDGKTRVWTIDNEKHVMEQEAEKLQFIRQNVEDFRRHSSLKYHITFATFNGEKTTDMRLFLYDGRVPCYYKARSSRRGYPLGTNVLRMEVKVPNAEKSKAQKFDENCDKVIKHLDKDGLWEDFKKDIQILKIVGYDLSKEFANNRWGSVFKDKTPQETYEIKSRDYLKVLEILKSKGRNDLVDRFVEVSASNKINENTVKYVGYPREMIGLTDLAPYTLFGNHFFMIDDLKIKKMIFHRGTYSKYHTETALKQIAEAIDKKESFKTWGDNGYDVSFEYNADSGKAWYSEEYRGCGNGHYYLALNRTHAIYCEKD